MMQNSLHGFSSGGLSLLPEGKESVCIDQATWMYFPLEDPTSTDQDTLFYMLQSK